MELRHEERDLKMGGLNAEKKVFNIKQSAKMFRILSDQLYSNKPAAIIRELGCNAWDAHVAAGKEDVPFRVHLPTFLEPWLEIEDYGTGLSEHDIMELYTTYGESTKTTSNLFIGALGLGSKSPFAYTDSFTVTSRFNGNKTTYTAYIDNGGQPTITKVSSIPMLDKEKNGLTIYVAVEGKDYSDFEKEAIKYYSYLPTKPKTNTDASFEEKKVLLEGTGWKLHESDPHSYYRDNSLVAIMGNVPYDIDINVLQSSFESEQWKSGIRPLLYCNISFEFNLGELDISASRESLSYDKETLENIKRKFEYLLNEIQSKIDDALTSADTLWEAFVLNKYLKNAIKVLDTKENLNFNYKGKEYSGIELCLDFTVAHERKKMSVYRFASRVFKNKSLGAFNNGSIKPTMVYKDKDSELSAQYRLHITPHLSDSQVEDILVDNNNFNNLNSNKSSYNDYYSSNRKKVKKTKFVWLDSSRTDNKYVPSRLHHFMQTYYADENLVVISCPTKGLFDAAMKRLGSPPKTEIFTFHKDIPFVPKESSQQGYTQGVKQSQTPFASAKDNEYQTVYPFDYVHSYYIQNKRSWPKAVNLKIDTNELRLWVDLRSFAPVYSKYDKDGSFVKILADDMDNSYLNSLLNLSKLVGIFDGIVCGVPGNIKNKIVNQKNWKNLFEYMEEKGANKMKSKSFSHLNDKINKEKQISEYFMKVMKQLDVTSNASKLKDNKIKQNIKSLLQICKDVGPADKQKQKDIERIQNVCASIIGKEKINIDNKIQSIYNTEYTLVNYPLLQTLGKIGDDQFVVTDDIAAIIDYLNCKYLQNELT